MSNELKCPICGEPTSVYMGNARKDRLCRKHGMMKNAGEISISDEGLFVEVATGNVLNPSAIESPNKEKADEIRKEKYPTKAGCIVCGAVWSNHPQCKNCYKKSQELIQELDLEAQKDKLTNSYFELYKKISKTNDITQKQNDCNKLIAISFASREYKNDYNLIERVYDDIICIMNTPTLPNDNTPVDDNAKDDTQLNEKSDIVEKIIIDKIKCITCGYESDGKLFCKRCYKKYCNKEILIKIKNCLEVVPLDDFYEGYYECDDGHVVKSMAERDIDDYLFSNNIKHGYEVPLPIIDDNGKKVILHPDFCIFDENSKPLYYIEYWGYDDNNRDYTKTRKYKLPLYKKAQITLININAKNDLRNLKTNLNFKLNNYEKGISNFENE